MDLTEFEGDYFRIRYLYNDYVYPEKKALLLAVDPGLYHLYAADNSSVSFLYCIHGVKGALLALNLQVYTVPVVNCTRSDSCVECVDFYPNPLCGWCTLEQKCSRQSQCQNSHLTKR